VLVLCFFFAKWRNIILVFPTEAPAQSANGHHTGWLQFSKTEKDKVALANLIGAGFAFPEHFGKPPEAIFIGLNKGQPNYPKWAEADKIPASADPKIKGLYLGNYQPRNSHARTACEMTKRQQRISPNINRLK
jgi:hypothetical protein